MIMQAQSLSIKTIYIGFHDGQKFGEKPFLQHEPIPIQLDITHSQAIKIVNHLYEELQRITTLLSKEDAKGSWS